MSGTPSTLGVIGQTCRTILFESFTDPSEDGVTDLYTLIDAAKVSKTFGKDEFYRKIETELMVKTFKEFLDKFSPVVYEIAREVNGQARFEYLTDKLQAQKLGGRPIKINAHPFYQMLENMYSKKGVDGLSNLEFPEIDVKKTLTPKSQMESVYDMRKRLKSLAVDLQKAYAANKNTLPYEEAIYNCRVEISEKFEDSPLALLSLAITEDSKKIEELDKYIKDMEALPDGETPAISAGVFTLDDNGVAAIKKIEAPTDTLALEAEPAKALEDDRIREVFALVASDVRENGPEGEFAKSLIISAYAPPEMTEDWDNKDLPALRQDVEKYKSRREINEGVYRQAQEAFITALTEMTQKVLSVKIFFDHVTTGGSNAVFSPGLLVTNCKISKFQSGDARADLQAVLDRLGSETNKKKVWLGILPDVDTSASGKKISGSGPVFSRPLPKKGAVKEEAAPVNENGVSVHAAKAFLEMMDKAGILTVFNFKPDKNNSFAGFSLETLETMRGHLGDIDNAHAICAYPNFTVMNEGTIELGSYGERLPVPAIYIGASYVAAGMIAASQQERILEAKGLKPLLLPGEVGTRIDLEDQAVSKSLTTNFNRELAYSWPADLVNEIIKSRFGFVFCGNYRLDPITQTPIKNTYILQASTLEKNGDQYQPVYSTLTQDFINNYLLYQFPNGGSRAEIESYVGKTGRDWLDMAEKGQNSKKINTILRKGETVAVEGEDDNFYIVITLEGGKISFKPRVSKRVKGDNK